MADIISVIIGGAIAISGGLVTQYWKHRRERRALAHALAGEIHAIVEMVERRGYQKFVSKLIDDVHTSQLPANVQVTITQNYFVVYESNALKIGLLPRLAAGDVASFYTLAKGLIEDSANNKFPPTTQNEAINRLSQMEGLLTTLTTLGKNVVLVLEKV